MDYAAALAWKEIAEEPYGSDAADPDLIEDLGDEIATLAAHIHGATHRFLVLIARFDSLKGWKRGGHRSCVRWLAFRTGLDPGTAREHVRVARALVGLPETSRAMGQGKLSFSQVRALTRVAEAETEADLLELAEGCTTAQLERVVRAWKRGSRGEEAARERARHGSRKLSVFPDEDGTYVVRGRLDPEVGALLMRAVEAASDALYREKRVSGEAGRAGEVGAGPRPDPEREAARRRADALGLLAERALAAGFGGAERGLEAEKAKGPSAEAAETRAGAHIPKAEPGAAETPEPGPPTTEPGGTCQCGSGPPAPEVPISGTRAERYQVILHVEPATLRSEGEPGREGAADRKNVSAETSHLEDGTRVSAETSRRLACDAALVRVTHAPDGSVLDVGRRRRTIPPALRRALEVRDRGCRFPGCGLRFTDAHHLLHWGDGGPTSLQNTLLLCRHHHRLVHENS